VSVIFIIVRIRTTSADSHFNRSVHLLCSNVTILYASLLIRIVRFEALFVSKTFASSPVVYTENKTKSVWPVYVSSVSLPFALQCVVDAHKGADFL
jgi:hypothetical protein